MPSSPWLLPPSAAGLEPPERAALGNPPAPLVGIARLAAASPQLASKRVVEYFSLASHKILNRTTGRMPFLWTVNPYRGCEFGCKYCYARYTHEFMGMEDPLQFEERIYAKEKAGEILLRELARDPGGAIAIGTATDPYQPAERQFRVTRGILETLARFRGLRLSITTKSDLPVRDLDLLREIGKQNEIQVNITITTLDEELARILEPRAPRPALRLRAVEKLAGGGVPCSVFAMPVLPGLTDQTENLEAVARAAAHHGAGYFAANALFLMPAAQKAFFPFLAERFPHLLARYQRQFARDAYMRGNYPKQIQEVARRLRDRYGLNRSQEGRRLPPFAPADQFTLFE